jgi:hypothetical protein
MGGRGTGGLVEVRSGVGRSKVLVGPSMVNRPAQAAPQHEPNVEQAARHSARLVPSEHGARDHGVDEADVHTGPPGRPREDVRQHRFGSPEVAKVAG